MSFSQGPVIESMKALGLQSNTDGVCAGTVALYTAYGIQGKEKEYVQLITRIAQPDYAEKANKLKEKIAHFAKQFAQKRELLREPVRITRNKIIALKKQLVDLKKDEKIAQQRIDAITDELNQLHAVLLIQIREREAKEMDLETNENYLTTKDREILETFPFIEWIDLTFQANEYQSFVGSYISQHNIQSALDTLFLDSSHKAEQVYIESTLFNEEEFTVYLNNLAKTWEGLKEKNLYMIIDGPQHRIGLKYDIDKKAWILSDPNQLPPFELKAETVTEIRKAAAPKTELNSQTYIRMNVYIFSDAHSPSLAASKEALSKFKESHIITPDMLERKSIKNDSTLRKNAIITGDIETLQKIIDQKADINQSITDKYESSAIHEAARLGYLSLFKMLKKNGANLTLLGTLGTPAHIAAKHGHVPILQELIDAKIDINNPDEKGTTLVHIAAEAGHNSVMQWLSESKDASINFNKPDRSGQTPIYLATKNGHRDMVNLLITKGVKLTSFEIQRLALEAAEKGHIPVIKLLIEHGLNIYQYKSTEGETLAHIAAKANQVSMIQFFAEQKVNLYEKNKTGETPIYIAATKGNAAIVKALIDNANDSILFIPHSPSGETLMTAAVKNGHVSVVRVLAEKDPLLLFHKNQQNKSPIDMAKSQLKSPCALIYKDFLLDSWIFLPKEANPAYIITKNGLYYGDKSKELLIEITQDKKQLEELNRALRLPETIELKEEERHRMLLPILQPEQLEKIASIAGHAFGTEMVAILESLQPAKEEKNESIPSAIEKKDELSDPLKLAESDPDTAQTLAFQAAKQGNADIIKTLAEKKLININEVKKGDLFENTLACVATEN